VLFCAVVLHALTRCVRLSEAFVDSSSSHKTDRRTDRQNTL